MAQAAQVQKPAKRTAVKPAVKAAAKSATLTHVIKAGFRPKAGAALYAHTQAFLELSGMLAHKPVPRATVEAAIGSTAVKYHLHECNMEATENGLLLTDRGDALFGTRSVDPEMLKAYRGVLSTGKVDGVCVKNPQAVAHV